MSKRILIFALAAVLILTSMAAANGLNLNGLGARAQAMGGAFVSVANDFSAVFWNPAGAAGFRKELFGFYAADLMPRATYLSEMDFPPSSIDAKSEFSHYIGFLGAYYRPIGSKVVVGLGIGTPSSQGIVWDGSDFAGVDETVYSWSRKTAVFSFSPLVAVKINEWLSVGATLNINLGTFNLMLPGGSANLGEGTVELGQYEENMTGWGFGATFGILARPIEKLGIGLAVRTPSTLAYNGTARLSYVSLYGLPDSSALERKIAWPLWIAGGVSFRPIEHLLLSADVQWTQWSKLGQVTTDYLEPTWSDYDFVQFFLGNYTLYHNDVTQIRFGAEYLLNPTTALRAGYHNDPGPGVSNSWREILFPGFTTNAISAGLGKAIGDLQLDFGLEYLTGKKREELVDIDGGLTNTLKTKIVIPSVSVQYRF
jgi:long-chain fatty acid transport protein